MPLSKEEVEKILKPWYSVFWICTERAFQRHLEIHQAELGAIQERTKSSYINDIIVDELKQSLSNVKNKEWESRYGAKRLWIGQICMRMKKFDRNLRPAVHHSQQAFDFSTHSIQPPVQLKFPDDGASPTCLFLGYITNVTKTGPQGIYIVCPKGLSLKGKAEIAWAFSVPRPEELPAIPPIVTPPTKILPGRVVPKAAKKLNAKKTKLVTEQDGEP